ncbi:MAG TPA: hypothetical protein VLD39_09645 [Gammaproteobacteria bacterium]|nr:hypothetical protein [Gammaproteobacteria bacterium]
MKYFLTWLVGFVVGVAAALALLYVNPMTRSSGVLPEQGDTVLSYASPVTDALAFTHGGLSRLPTKPHGVPELWESTIAKSALGVLILRGSDGVPAAIASRVSYPSEDSELLQRGAILNDEWLISMPGQGSLYITAQSNWWPLLAEALIPVWYLDRSWQGPTVYEPTAGPASGRQAIVVGASGTLAGRSGTAVERYQVESFDDRVGPQRVYAEIYWRFDETAPAPTTN